MWGGRDKKPTNSSGHNQWMTNKINLCYLLKFLKFLGIFTENVLKQVNFGKYPENLD